MRGYRVLSFAAASHKLGCVFLVGRKLIVWRMSRLSSLSPEAARRFAERWIGRLRPDVVVTEDITLAKRKGGRTRTVIAAIAEVAAEKGILVVAIPRPRQFPNKYAEATALAERFPELKPKVPKPRRLWDGEPRTVAYFEALVLALAVIDTREAEGEGGG